MTELEAWKWLSKQECTIDVSPLTKAVKIRVYVNGKCYKARGNAPETSMVIIDCVHLLQDQLSTRLTKEN